MVRGALPLKGFRVLIAEGDYILASDLRRLMREAGATVIGPAWSCQTGLDLAISEVLDAALVNARLADGSAEPVATKLMERGVPFVVIAERETDILRPVLREAPCLDKPIRYDDLIAIFAKWHGQRAVDGRNERHV